MKKRLLIFGLAAVALGAAFFYNSRLKGQSQGGEPVTNVRVCQVIEHEALAAVVTGLKEGLAADKTRRYNVTVETCQGNAATAAQILEKFANSPTDVAVTVGTLPSQVAFKMAQEGRLKVIFASVTNPNDIAPSFEKVSMTGVSNFVPLQPQLEMFRKIQPPLKTLGMVYNTSEANSVYIIRQMEPLCRSMGLRLVTQGISKITELWQAVEKILPLVDAVFISNDNLVLSCMENLCALCAKKNIPVYVSDTDQVAKGCVAALGPNQVDIGRQAAALVKRVVNGEAIRSLAPEASQTMELVVNTAGPLPIPEEVRAKATKVLSGGAA